MTTDAMHSETDRERDRVDRDKNNTDRSEMGGSKQKTCTNSKTNDVPCKFYNAGVCTAGSSYPFSHSTGEPGAQKEACIWFVKENCKFGHKCALAHILPGQSMAMDRKNKKAAQLAVSASASTGAGAEKSARSGVRGFKRVLGSGGNGASGRLPLLGPTAPTRIMSAGSSGSTSSAISPSAPAPPLEVTDFTSLAALDEMEGFQLPSSSSQQVYQPERISEEPRTPDADLSKAGATDVPVTPTVLRLSMNNNSSTSNAINSSHNDTSTAISGSDEQMHASMPARSAGYSWQGEDHTQPPHQHSQFSPQIPSTGGPGTPTNLDSSKNTSIKDVFNNNSKNYLREDEGGAPPDNRKQHNIPDWMPGPVLGLTQGITTCWIAAEHALQHARNNISSVSKVFDKWEIQKSDYAVLAGFDESLVKSGVGYLEQIHVFTIAEVDPSSSLLTELGELFSPFSSILFTESSSYRLPVFKNDGSEWEFDELVYLTASKIADDGSSTKTPPTIISLNNQNSSSPDGFLQSEGSSDSGEGEKNKKLTGEAKEMDDKADKDNEDSSDKPTGDHPRGEGDGTPAACGQDSPREITIAVDSEIYHNQERYNLMGPSQTLTMLGSLTIQTKHDDPQYSERIVKFTGFNYGNPNRRTENAYKQIHLRVFVDSREPKAFPNIGKIKPTTTPASDGGEEHSSSKKLGWTGDMTAMLSRGLNFLGSSLGGLTKTSERTEGSEKKRYSSPITQHYKVGRIWWDYEIGDDHFQKEGYKMPGNVFPIVHFEFDNTSPPKHIDIAITSFWSKISPFRSEQNRTLIHKLLHLFRSAGGAQCISFSNLFQIVALTADVEKLIRRNHYAATVKMYLDSGISTPPKPEPKAESLERIEGTSVVVDDLEELEDFPTTRNTEYKVSDIRYSEWEKKYKKKIPKFHFL